MLVPSYPQQGKLVATILTPLHELFPKRTLFSGLPKYRKFKGQLVEGVLSANVSLMPVANPRSTTTKPKRFLNSFFGMGGNISN